MKPFTRLTFRSPPSAAEPVATSCPNWPLAGVPPICTASDPAAACVKLPPTLSVLPAPTVRFPLLLKPPAVVKPAPPVRLRLPLLEASPDSAAIVAPLPPRAMVAALPVMVVPLGNCRVAPSSAFQVPPVKLPLESWANVVGSRSSVPESASIVPVLVNTPVTEKVEVPVPPVFSIVPSLTTALAWPSSLMPAFDSMT